MPASRRAIIVLPPPGAPIKQNVVAARGGDLERALGHALADDVGEIGFGIGGSGRQRRPEVGTTADASLDRRRAGSGQPRIQRLDRLDQRINRQHLQPFDDAGLGRVRARQENRRLALALCGHGNRQHAANRLNRSVERQLAEQDDPVDAAAAR